MSDESKKDGHLEEVKLSVDVMKHLTTLATGTLLLVVGLHEKFSTNPAYLVLPAVSMMFSVVLAVLYLYAVGIDGVRNERTTKLLALASVLCFGVGIGSLTNIARHTFR